jgi:hypothetical protein
MDAQYLKLEQKAQKLNQRIEKREKQLADDRGELMKTRLEMQVLHHTEMKNGIEDKK